jgi:hypothetical protein
MNGTKDNCAPPPLFCETVCEIRIIVKVPCNVYLGNMH